MEGGSAQPGRNVQILPLGLSAAPGELILDGLPWFLCCSQVVKLPSKPDCNKVIVSQGRMAFQSSELVTFIWMEYQASAQKDPTQGKQ